MLAPSIPFEGDEPFAATSIDVLSNLDGEYLQKIARGGALEKIEPTKGEEATAKAPGVPEEAPAPNSEEPSKEERREKLRDDMPKKVVDPFQY